MLILQFQQFDLLRHCFFLIKIRTIKNFFNFFFGKCSAFQQNFTDCQKKDALSLADYLDHYIFNNSDISTVEPVPDDVTGFNTFIMNYKKMLPVEKTAVTTNI